MGDFLLLRGLWSERETLNLLTLQVARTAEQLAAEGRALGNLGVVYRNQGRWQEAIEQYEKSFLLFRQLGDKQGEGATLSNMAVLHEKQNDIPRALERGRKALAVLEQTEDGRSAETVRGWIAEWEQQAGY